MNTSAYAKAARRAYAYCLFRIALIATRYLIRKITNGRGGGCGAIRTARVRSTVKVLLLALTVYTLGVAYVFGHRPVPSPLTYGFTKLFSYVRVENPTNNITLVTTSTATRSTTGAVTSDGRRAP